VKVAFSCVVDAKPRFEWQAFVLVNSLLRNVGCRPFDIKVHCLPGVTSAFRDSMNNFGIDIVEIQPFNGHPYCNKVQQCFSSAFDDYERVILLDSDLFVFGMPSISASCPFSAKIVDIANPPLNILSQIYDNLPIKIKKPRQTRVDFSLSDNDLTYANNFNGGLYIIDQKYLLQIGTFWKKHAEWLLTQSEILDVYWQHIDQIAMSLALSELGIDYQPLDRSDNFPVHLMTERVGDSFSLSTDIKVLHYHNHVLPDGKIKYTGSSDVDAYISRANHQIESLQSRFFNNQIFWNMRYELFPELGSGIGSRGDVLQQKRNLLECSLNGFMSKRVVDVGCGDLELVHSFEFKDYTGYDVSQVALSLARKRRPHWNFIQGHIYDFPNESADLVICLDVLIHQKDRDEYFRTLRALSQVAQQRLIVSGYDKEPEIEYFSDICAYHEPISKSIRDIGVFNEVVAIGHYRGLAFIVADKTITGPKFHPSDLPSAALNEIISYVDRKAFLRLIMDISRDTLGFYTKTSIRAIEYPWAFARIIEIARGMVLDIGAGVSPLPILLAAKGYSVTTVDFSSIRRNAISDDRIDWNEWGFLDYSDIISTITSYNEDILRYSPKQLFDVIYSVSVIEHMPRQTWEKLLRLVAKWLKPGGRLIITLDLVPNTDFLWNFSGGLEVESISRHGTLQDFRKNLHRNNFIEKDLRVVKGIPFSRTDVVLIDCELLPHNGWGFMQFLKPSNFRRITAVGSIILNRILKRLKI